MDDEEVPTGFRFYPTEEELVSFYLRNKLSRTRPEIDRVIPVVDVYAYNPSDLPRLGGEYSPGEGEQWFFFSGRRQDGGGRANCLTKCGYWKATGSAGDVYSSQNRVIGRKRTMVFYVGRAPNGAKTTWKMTEYKAFSGSTPQLREELCLCRIYKGSKSLRAFDRRPPSAAVASEGMKRRRNAVAAFDNPRPLVPEMTDFYFDTALVCGEWEQSPPRELMPIPDLKMQVVERFIYD